MPTRRQTITILGGGVLAAGAASAGGFAATRTPHAALAPWEAAGTMADARLHALAHAILAPNPHNIQPWMAELTEGGFRLHRDPERSLPHTDPHGRQIVIGLGCFIEQAAVAASERGLLADVTLWPDGPGGPVAEAALRDGGAPDPLAPFIMDRRSCKEPFTDTPLTDGEVEALSAHATILTDAPTVEALRELTWAAWLTEAHTPRTHRESVDLMRFGRAEIEASPDGIDLGGAMLEGLMVAGLMTRRSVADPASTAFAQAAAIYDEMLHATPAHAALISGGNAPEDWIAAGRGWLRLNLATTALGLSLHPVSQALQEYPEMAPHYDAVHALLAPGGGTVQMLGRVGHGPRVPRTPRWPLEAKLIG